jgi:hypothetical protein
VYEVCKVDIQDWIKEVGLTSEAVREEYHLDEGKNTRVMILSIDKGTKISEEQVDRFNYILREGFRTITK